MTTLEMETVLKLPVERRILLIEDVWDSIRSESDNVPVPDSHKRELDSRLKKYTVNPSALLTEQQLKMAVNTRR